VLVAADLSGIDSHGVARLRRYVEGVATGAIDGRAEPVVVVEHPATALLDAGNGLGQPAAVAAMELAVTKAEVYGIGIVAVRRTNHFGIAGYYASLAARRGLIGIATTNATPQVAPTFAAEPLYGTNPIAIALPTGGKTDFLFDAATSTVGRGKLEIRHRRGEPIPTGWVIDGTGAAREDVEELIEGLKRRSGYALLPLGGEGESHGGHKGYALGLFVDLLCGPLTGAAWGRHVYGADGANLGHCCIAIRVDCFRPLEDFQEECQRLFDEIRAAKRAPGAARIFVPGEKDAEERRRRERDGIPLTGQVRDDLARLAAELDLPSDEVLRCE
jgi:L-2-hydroxycarboxylate dehydrogenase (NAD+)